MNKRIKIKVSLSDLLWKLRLDKSVKTLEDFWEKKFKDFKNDKGDKQ